MSAERFHAPPPEVVAELRRYAERSLTHDEFEAWVHAPMGDDERDEIDSLIAWFTRRYPTPAERLAYARRAYARWARGLPPSK